MLVTKLYWNVVNMGKTEKIDEVTVGKLLKLDDDLILPGELVERMFKPEEQVKKICLLSAPFAEETGELTPTLKMKRRVITDKYSNEIESLY